MFIHAWRSQLTNNWVFVRNSIFLAVVRCFKIIRFPRCDHAGSTLTLQACSVHTAEAKCPRPAGRVQHPITLPAAGPSPCLLPLVARSDGRMLPSLALKWTTWTSFCPILCSADGGFMCFRFNSSSNLSLRHISSEQVPLYGFRKGVFMLKDLRVQQNMDKKRNVLKQWDLALTQLLIYSENVFWMKAL